MLDPFLAARLSRSKSRQRLSWPRAQQPHDEGAAAPLIAAVKSPAIALSKRGLRIGRTRLGKGLFATKRIVDGSCIGEIQGQIIDDDDYVSRYAFDLNDGQQLEPEAPFRFVNHSCEPNCAFECFSFPGHNPQPGAAAQPAPERVPSGQRKLLLFAICDIDIGQELTIDYNWPAVFAIPCGCRAEACRGWIVTPKDLPKLLHSLAHHPA